MGLDHFASSFASSRGGGKREKYWKCRSRLRRPEEKSWTCQVTGYPDGHQDTSDTTCGALKRERQTSPPERQCIVRHCHQVPSVLSTSKTLRVYDGHVGKQTRSWSIGGGTRSRKRGIIDRVRTHRNLNVGALRLDMAGLLALVADLLAGA